MTLPPSPAALAALRAEWDRIQHFGPEMYMAATMAFVPKLLKALAASSAIPKIEPVYPPRLLTRRATIQDVAARWWNQYNRGGTWSHCTGDARVIYEGLAALNPDTATREEVDGIIGNTSWTAIRCTACQRDVDIAAEVGELPDYESSTVTLCAECIALTGDLIRVAAGSGPTGPVENG